MILLAILVVSLATHFYAFGFPTSVVFDEVFYGNFIAHYWQGTYFFDLHPPFAKLLLAFVGWLFGLSDYTADWTTIGNVLPDALIYLRLIPLLAGTLLPLVIYYLCRRLNISKIASFTAALLICLESSLIVQSRFILPDLIMLLIGFTSFLCYFEYRQRLKKGENYRLFLYSAIILASLAFSIKWTGLSFLFLIIFLEGYEIIGLWSQTQKPLYQAIKKFCIFIVQSTVIAFVLYATFFAIHFALLPKSGPGDLFMSPSFQKTLSGNQYASDPNLTAPKFSIKFLELNSVMFTGNVDMTATHAYSSEWYTWPLMWRSIFYWQSASTTAPTYSYIYLLGNPFVYWFGTVSILSLIIFFIVSYFSRNLFLEKPAKKKVLLFIVIGYTVNLIPFAYISRVMFLYHYETALVFSIIGLAFLLDFLAGKKRTLIASFLILIALTAFLYWSPLTYGRPLSDEQLKSRMWLPTWR